ncbi:MAG: hypothetical protein NC910_00390 [Candidatus Omnitrophica bacterium]|nr:hypothetical protein [Candidatus Omnitrophota bacterium]
MTREVIRSIALGLALMLLQPSGAFALRPISVKEGGTAGELARNLQEPVVSAGLEEPKLTRRDFLKGLILGLGAVGLPLAAPAPLANAHTGISTTSMQIFQELAALVVGQVPAQDPVAQPLPPAGLQRTPVIRGIQSELLANQAARPPRIRFLQEVSRRITELRNMNDRFVSLFEFEEALTAVQQSGVFDARTGVLELLQQHIGQVQPGAAPPGQGLFPSLFRQIAAEVQFAQMLERFLSRWVERVRPLLAQQFMSEQEFDILQTARDKGRVRLSILEELQRLYADLSRVGEILPVPVAFTQEGRIGEVDVTGAVPPVTEPRQELTQEQKNRLLASVRLRIWKILELEKQRLQMDLDFRLRWAGRIERLEEQFRGYFETNEAWFLRQHAAPTRAQQAMLSAQQVQVLMGGENNPVLPFADADDLPDVLPAADMTAVRSVLARRRTPTDVQRALDSAIRADAQAAETLARSALRYHELNLRIAQGVNRRLTGNPESGLYSSITMNEFRYNIVRAQIHRDRIVLQRELAEHLRVLGFPEPILRSPARFSSSLDAQSLVQPLVLGLAEAPPAEQVQDRIREIRRIQRDLADIEVRILQPDIDELEADARPVMNLLAADTPQARHDLELLGTWTVEDVRGWSAEAGVLRLQQEARRKEKDILAARTQEAFDTALQAYERALAAHVRADMAYVRDRERILRGRADWMRQRNREEGMSFYSDQEIESMETRAAVLGIRRQELALLDRLYTAMQGWLPPVDLQRPTADAGGVSPDIVALLLRQVSGPVRAPGSVRLHGGEETRAVWFGSQWIWLSGPPVLAGPDGFGENVEFVRIPEGRPGAGNFILRERLQKLKADIGYIVGPASSSSLGQTLYVFRWGPQPYQGRSGYYPVEAAEGVLVVGEQAIRLGLVARRDPANATRLLPPTHGLVGFVAREMRTVYTADRRPVQELVPAGVVVQEIPLAEYNRRGDDGREAPIPLTGRRVGGSNVLDYGVYYRGGLVTYGPRGEAYVGRAMNDPGQRLPVIFEQVGAQFNLVEKEVRVAFLENENRLTVTFDDHTVAVLGGRQPAPAAPEQPGRPGEVPEQEWAAGLDIPWWGWAAGGTAVAALAGGAAYLVWRSRHAPPGETSEAISPQDTNPPASSAGLEQEVTRMLHLLSEAAQGPGVLVIQADVFQDRSGLLEFVSRIPPELSRRVVIFAPSSAGLEGQEEVRKRNPKVTIVDTVMALAEHLIQMQIADRIAFLGEKLFADLLRNMVPPSMKVVSVEKITSLLDALQYLGISNSWLDNLRMFAGLEDSLAVLRSA